jgi:uracil-DNA glycosylase
MSTLLNKIDLEEVKEKLYLKLKPSGWGDKLKTFIRSNDFDKILMQLLKEARNGQRFTPVLKQVFRAFEECPYKDLKVVMLGQDPYPYGPKNIQGTTQPSVLPVADGIAFSCANTGQPEASLRYMFKEIEETVYAGKGYTWDPDLKRWSNQGILLLNSALTTTIGKVGQHYLLWQPLLAFVFDTLMYQNPGLIYVFMGKKAQEWAESIPENNFKINTSHPAFAAHQDAERWDSGDMFNQVSKLVKSHYKEEIIW